MTKAAPNADFPSPPVVVILDFGSQFTQLIARAVRGLGVYCEIEPFSISVAQLMAKSPSALILSGGPESVSSGKAPKLMKAVLEADLPVLGICYGMQLLSHVHSGKIVSGASREYGASEIEVLEPSGLFQGFRKGDRLPVWMSHGDSVESVPPGAVATARTKSCPVAALRMGRFHAVQFHPEVSHTAAGPQILSNFLFGIAGLKGGWRVGKFLEQKSEELRARIGNDEVIGGVSGGVDSSLLAVVLTRILGKKFHPVLIDNGLLRRGEVTQVKALLQSEGVRLEVIDGSKLFLKRLQKVRDPERKRKIIGKTFIELFETRCKKLPKIRFLAQGTLYPDVIESISVKGPSHTIKTHHNVGGLPKRMKLSLIEPFRELFKDEVRALGREIGVSEALLMRHPFPGPGLAVRILGDVTPAKIELLRHADEIFMEELRSRGLYDSIWQAFAVLLPVQTVGVMGDARTYEAAVALRAVTSRDGMTADWYAFDKDTLSRISSRIINEVKGINRVVYDVSSKPPATIEWE